MRIILTTLAAATIFVGGWLGAQVVAPSSAAHLPGCQDCPSVEKTVEQFGLHESQDGFDAQYDLNHDGAITIGDIMLAARCNYMDWEKDSQ